MTRTTSATTTTTLRHANATLAGWMAGSARRTWNAYWDWQARRTTVRILRALDSRTLRDIGLTPTEIESVVYGRCGDRRRGYYARWRLHGRF